MSTTNALASGVVLLYWECKVSKSGYIGFVEPHMLEFGCSCLYAPEHPPAGNDGDVSGGEGIGEPIFFLRYAAKILSYTSAANTSVLSV